jgi:glycosidase
LPEGCTSRNCALIEGGVHATGLFVALLSGPAEAQGTPDWANEIIYFVMIDRFADGDPTNNATVDPANPLAFHGGDLVGLTARLPEIADLGATAIWITPVVAQVPAPILSDGVPFYGHHGYWAEDFTILDPHYGAEAELTAMVNVAHDLGLKVLLDVVYNHMGYGAGLTVTQPDWFRLGAQCGGDDVTTCLADLPDLRTELPEVRDYLFDAHLGLAERTGVDGFRLDTFKHVGADFWAAHRDTVDARLGTDFFLLGEIWNGDRFLAEFSFAADTLDGLLDFSFRDKILAFLNGISGADRLATYLTNRHDVSPGHVMAPFLSSHDTAMMLAMLRGDTARLRIAFALLMMAEGPPIITWGEEVGRKGGVWPENRGDMAWADLEQPPGAGLARDEALRADIAILIDLRRSDPAFHTGPLETLAAGEGFLLLQRGPYLIAVNRGPDPVAVGGVGIPDRRYSLLFGDGPDDPRGAALMPGPGVTIWRLR